VGHHAVQEMMEILGYRKVCSCWVHRLLTGTEEHKPAGNCSPSTLQSGFYPLRLPLVRALERSPDRSPLRDWRGSLGSRAELVATSRTDFYRRDVFNILQRWQKWIHRGGDFVETQ
jgi:hypothetical protein